MRTAQLDQIVRQKDPELLKAVEHLARNETHTGISLLQAQGRVTELSNPQERIAAIARDYASNPEKTLIVSPDNASRRDINQAVRIELQASGALGKENVSFPVLVARNDMSGADRAWAARYTPGDTVRYMTDPANNLVTVARADGQHVAYDPQRLRGVNVYTNLPAEFSTGDRIQFTHNNKDLDVHNRDRGRIEAIDNDNRLTVRMDDGRTVNFDPARMRHFDHGYAVTSHSSQGLTENRVLVNMDTNAFSGLLNPRFAYVSISRASQDAHIYTNDAATLVQRLSTDMSKTSALDFHEAPAAHSQSQTPKEHTMQHLNELKPEEQSQLTPEQAERNRQYGPIQTALPTEAQGYKWQRETDGIHSYQHPETHRWLHIDTQGQFFDRHAQPITRENALEQAGHSLTQSVSENAHSPTGSGLNLNAHGISL
jgi:ATP-dependent exoDNAse (exonuclease V) alpha subunit